ncbi:MAG TPA: hypothetical protein VFV78_12820 [Vicinamibacterales bacterium]|nr:hypothetical protein [Vicinamibacterales bacterium]
MSADEAGLRVKDRTLDIPGAPLPAIMLRILESGGLVPFLLANGGFGTSV